MSLDNRDRLTSAIIKIRNNNIAGLEDLYLLTYKDTYKDIKFLSGQELDIWEKMIEVYIQVWNRSVSMPESNLIRPWIRILIKDVLNIEEDIDITVFSEEDIDDKNLEEKSYTALLQIEEKLGFLQEKEEEALNEKNSIERFDLEEGKKLIKSKFFFYRIIYGILLFFILLILISVLMKSNIIKKSIKKDSIQESVAETIIINETIEEFVEKYGWNEYKNGTKKYKKADGEFVYNDWLEYEDNLYYFDESGVMLTKALHMQGQNFEFSESGELISISREYEIENKNTILNKEFEQLGIEDKLKRVVKDSIVQDGEWIYYLETLPDAMAFPGLIRIKKSVGNMEMVDEEVEGYIIVGDKIWYSKAKRIYSFLKSDIGQKLTDEYIIGINENRYSLYDGYGNLILGNEAGFENIGNRIYRIDKGKIKYVTSGEQKIGAYTFHINTENADNNIYLGDGNIFVTEGKDITAICVVGNYLYFSAVEDIDEQSNPISKIFKVDIETGERKVLTDGFSGAILNMYYYRNNGGIYMEYAPESSYSTYGKVAVLSNEDKLYLIDDRIERENGYQSGLDTLEIIMVSEDNIYCYWHDCQIDGSVLNVSVVDTKTLRLDNKKRIELD